VKSDGTWNPIRLGSRSGSALEVLVRRLLLAANRAWFAGACARPRALVGSGNGFEADHHVLVPARAVGLSGMASLNQPGALSACPDRSEKTSPRRLSQGAGRGRPLVGGAVDAAAQLVGDEICHSHAFLHGASGRRPIKLFSAHAFSR
jgi:hypothetical protein